MGRPHCIMTFPNWNAVHITQPSVEDVSIDSVWRRCLANRFWTRGCQRYWKLTKSAIYRELVSRSPIQHLHLWSAPNQYVHRFSYKAVFRALLHRYAKFSNSRDTDNTTFRLLPTKTCTVSRTVQCLEHRFATLLNSWNTAWMMQSWNRDFFPPEYLL